MNKKNIQKNKSGFTLMEILIAIFIFVLIIAPVIYLFVSSFRGYNKTKIVQKNLEEAQYAMNLMAKSLRTSELALCDGYPCAASQYKSVRVFDFSQGLYGQCIEYSIDEINKRVTKRSSDYDGLGSDPVAWCQSSTTILNVSIDLAEGVSAGSFSVSPTISGLSSGNQAGKATIFLQICQDQGCSGLVKDLVKIQTSVSLRNANLSDYREIAP